MKISSSVASCSLLSVSNVTYTQSDFLFPISNFGEISLPYHFLCLFLDHVSNMIFIWSCGLEAWCLGLGASVLITSLLFWLSDCCWYRVQFIQSSCTPVIRALEPSLSLKAKDELATVLVNVLQSIDAARDFLVDVVMDEVTNEGDFKQFSVTNLVLFYFNAVFYVLTLVFPICSTIKKRVTSTTATTFSFCLTSFLCQS